KQNVVLGSPKFWWLRALNTSHRNSTYLASVRWKSFINDESRFQKPGPRMASVRGFIFPNVQARGSVGSSAPRSPNAGSKAAGLIQSAICWDLERCPLK